MAQHNFLQDEFKQFHLAVAFDQPLRASAKIAANCSAVNCRNAPSARLTIGKCACAAAVETSGNSAAVFCGNRRVETRLASSASCVARIVSSGLNSMRVNQRDGIERFARGGLDAFGQRIAQLLGVFQMQRRGIAEIRQDGMRFDDRRFFGRRRRREWRRQAPCRKDSAAAGVWVLKLFGRLVASVVADVGKFSVEIRVERRGCGPRAADAFRAGR